ncbi:MAG: single-stranded DNA-binding protein [Erysipelotrichaceae bacterium]|nr:single-stranded DNA-binding protein [Erysipelotrichaceae bacterium]
MLNSAVIVGKISDISKSYTNERGLKETRVIIKVERSKYVTDHQTIYDHIPVVINEGNASMLNDYCTIGTMIAVKGRLGVDDICNFKLVCEKISFVENHIAH